MNFASPLPEIILGHLRKDPLSAPEKVEARSCNSTTAPPGARRARGEAPLLRSALSQAQPWTLVLLVGVLLLLAACSTRRPAQAANARPFQFQTDTFAYANELVWEYYYDEAGRWQHRKNEEEPDYTHHCFVVARSARQFFQHAQFDASLPKSDDESYLRLIREVVSRDPAESTAETERILIPGYPDLRSFSEAKEELLKETCGGAWQSYTQRGHWRMIFPFSRKGQEKEAKALATAVQSNRPPIIHVVTFPKILINHSILLYAVETDENALKFTAYDPNQPEAPTILTYDRTLKQFTFPANDYWKGGKLNVYEIYRSWNY
jgi:hypothetical protein